MNKIATGTSEEAIMLWNKHEQKANFSIDIIKTNEYALYSGDVEEYLSGHKEVSRNTIILDEDKIAITITEIKKVLEEENSKTCKEIVEFSNPNPNLWNIAFVF